MMRSLKPVRFFTRKLASAVVVASTFVSDMACKPKPAIRGSASAVVAGRKIMVSVEGSGVFVHTNRDAATVRFRGHKVQVETERVVVDGGKTADISSNATIVEIVVRNDGEVTVNADGVKVMKTRLRK